MKTTDQNLLNGMGVLSAIVNTGGFGRAAEALDMSQSGVSRALGRLEARLGVRLLERTTRSVTLTDDGKRLYEQVMPLLEALEEATTATIGGANTARGRLRVNIDPFFSRLVLAPRLGAFIERYPDLRLELVTRDQLGDMVGDGFDLAIRFGYPRSSSLVARKLLDTRILTVAAPAYLKRHGRPLKPTDLSDKDHACVQFRDPNTGRPFDWEFHRGDKMITVDVVGVLTVNDVGTMHNICLAGHAIAQVMELGVEHYISDGRLVNLFTDWPDDVFPMYAYYPSRHHVPAKVRVFLEFIMEVANQTSDLASKTSNS